MPAGINRKVDMRGLVLQVAGIEEKPTGSANKTIASGSTKTLLNSDSGAYVQLDTLTGSTVTLPAGATTALPNGAAIGTKFTFTVSVVPTSNNHIVKVANANDIMMGVMETIDTSTGALAPFGTAAASDTITLNRSTTGGVRVGETFTVEYVGTNRWVVWGCLVINGVAATPFSATV
jgi:hypothetical protein